ncbi:MAG: ABC transporter permease [Phycisphaerae bacterium]
MSQATNITIADPAGIEDQPGRSLWSDALHRLMRSPAAVICFSIIVVYALVAIITPLVVGDWQTLSDYDNINAAPSWNHPLGTDSLGRSILIKTMLGAHVSMTVAFLANAIAIPVGMILGALAGYFGKRIDDLVVWMYTTLASIPGIIRLIAIKFAFTGIILFEYAKIELPFTGRSIDLSIDLSGMAGIIIALGVMSWIGTCRLVRAEVMKLRETDYVMAARAAGRGNLSILFRHIIPNVLHIGIINFSLGFVGAISAEVILSYLNLGVQDLPSWGKMINSARMDLVVGRWTEIGAAVTATFVIILAWNIFGDRLRDALDPRLRNE